MNIAYFSHYFTPEIGAPSARINDLSQQWFRLGHQVQVVTCFPNHPTGRLWPGYKSCRYFREDLDGVTVHRHWTYITPNKGFLKKSIGHVSYLLGARFSGRHMRECDVVIGTSPTFFAAIAAASFARRRKVPFIMEVRDLWPAIFVELGVITNRRIIRLLERWEMSLYRQATKIVVVTQAFRENLIQRGVSKDKIVTIQNGADTEFWQPLDNAKQVRDQLNLQEYFVVLYIGAHGISHALDRILDSAADLQKVPEIQFLFVGEGAEKENLKRRAAELQLTNLTFLDAVGKDEVRQYYAAADVCLVPLKNIPLFEKFIPSKIFEIMAMGRPIIGSVRGEAAEILTRSGGARIVEPENSEELTQAILDLYQRPQARDEMSKAGRDFVVREFSRQRFAAEYLNLLEESIAEYSRQG